MLTHPVKLKQFIWLTVFSLIINFTIAQSLHRFSITFSTNSAQLSPQAIKSIDSVLAKLRNNPVAYKLSLTGHSDSTGHLAVNQLVSLNRAKTTAQYFVTKRFLTNKIMCEAKAFQKPLTDNQTEEKKQHNRRVEINIALDLPAAPKVGGLTLKDDLYTITANSGTTIIYPSGTKINIEPDAFVDKNGKPVTGTVQLVYKEYRSASDFMLAGIPMDYTDNNELYHFNSAGMFKILANQNGTPVYLKPGRDIKLDFPLEKNLPNLNLYRLDETKGQWKEIAKLNGPGEVQMGAPGVNGRNRFGGGGGGRGHGGFYSPSATEHNGNACRMDGCSGVEYIAGRGIKLAQSDIEFSKWMGKTDTSVEYSGKYTDTLDKINKKTIAIQAWIKSFEDKKNRSQHVYMVQKNYDEKNKFQVVCQGGGENEMNALRNPSWTFASKKHKTISDTIYKTRWSTCEIIETANKDYKIKLSAPNEKHYSITGLKMILQDNVRGKKRARLIKRLFEKYDSTKTLHESKINRLIERIDSLKKEEEKPRKLWSDITAEMSKFDDDNKACCFWERSRPYMSPQEARIATREAWLFYFANNKTKMLKRYTGLNDSAAAICKRIQEELKKMALANEAAWTRNNDNSGSGGLNGFMEIGGGESNFKKGEDLDKTREVFKQLSVKGMGVYNCDQIYRMSEPIIEILANYKTQGNKNLNVILIYLIDDAFNGILRYDGLSGLGPNLFKLSTSSKNTLIAFDEAFNAYVFKPEKFKAMPVPKSSSLAYTFEMEPVGNLPNQKALDKLLK